MKTFPNTRSAVEPQPKVVDDYSVWISDNIHTVTVTDEEGNEREEFEYDLTQYDKDEYIRLIDDRTDDVEMAIIELYESIS
jgi:hypothetical protein